MATMTVQDNYCATCYSAADKAGRTIRLVVLGDDHLRVCELCEGRLRQGLVHYRPSSGSEFGCFLASCFECRHYTDDMDNPQPGRLEPPYTACAWGVLDRFLVQMPNGYDHISCWFDPADIETRDADGGPHSPALCRRYTHKSDGDGETRDPPRLDVPGQMTFGEIDVPRELPTPTRAGLTPHHRHKGTTCTYQLGSRG